jgi:AraC family ethanolamine operon transcriptional activator
MTIHRQVTAVAKMPGISPTRTCTDLVAQAETLALSGLDERLQISGLCDVLAVSERTLRKAFHKIYGAPPCRHLRMLRLSQARRALLAVDSAATTVTEIAMDFGFLELGRFSVEYREAFGESPSQTLQRASPDKSRAVERSVRHSSLCCPVAAFAN